MGSTLHPAIIPRDVFNQVREEMTRRASKRKVMQKTGKTEQGKYSSKYALSELLVCGECGTPYKRCTWSRNGKKRIVWRCISRLEFGTKHCHYSPTLDEDRLHSTILSAINAKAMGRNEISGTTAEFIHSASARQYENGVSLLSLQSRLDEITAQQSELLDMVLDDMDNSNLKAQLKALSDEKQNLQKHIQTMQSDEQHQTTQQARLNELEDFIRQNSNGFTEYDDEITRRVIEKITVVNAQMIRIKYRDSDAEIERPLI